MAQDDYCRQLRASGVLDTPNGDCRRLYDLQRYRQQAYDSQAAAHRDGVERQDEYRRRMRRSANILMDKPSTTCVSRTNASGNVITECEQD
jgi:hypothetical protein